MPDIRLSAEQLRTPMATMRTKDVDGNTITLDSESPSMVEVAKTLNALGGAVGQLHEKMKQVSSKKDGESALDKEAFERINKSIDGLSDMKDRLDQLESATKRSVELDTGETMTVGEMTMKMNRDQVEYKKQFWDVLLKGDKSQFADGLDELAKKALSVNSNEQGGYLVSPDMSGRIIQRVYETSPMRSVASVAVVTTDSHEGLRVTDEFGAGWVGETGERNETDVAKLGKWNIPTHEMYAMPAITTKMLQDANTTGIGNVESFIVNQVGLRMGRLENAAFINGDGVSKPNGLLNMPNKADADDGIEQIDSGVNGELTVDAITKLIYALKDEYAGNATLAAGRLTWGAIRLLKDADGRPLWQPSLQIGTPATYMGVPTITFNDMPKPAVGSLSLAYGDFREGYQIVDRMAMNVLRDPYTKKGFVLMYTTKRVGGSVINGDAIKLLKLSE